MASGKRSKPDVVTYGDHEMITPDTAKLRKTLRAALPGEEDPIARAEAALKVVLFTFAGHRRLARLFMVEALGSGPEFNARMIEIRAAFADLIRGHLDAAVALGAIPPIDTATAATAWFVEAPYSLTVWSCCLEVAAISVAVDIKATLER